MRRNNKPKIIASQEVRNNGGYTDPLTGNTRGNKGGGAAITAEAFSKKFSRRKMYGPAIGATLRLGLSGHHNAAAKKRTNELRSYLVDHPGERKSLSPLTNSVNRGRDRNGVQERYVQVLKDIPKVAIALGVLIGADMGYNTMTDNAPQTNGQVTVHQSGQQNGGNELSPGIKIGDQGNTAPTTAPTDIPPAAGQ